MDKNGLIIALVTIVGISIGIWLWSTYNRLVRLRNQVDTAWAQVETELERRLDLIPNVVATVKGYAAHERETLEAVIIARSEALSASLPSDSFASQDNVSAALSRLFALSERYPALKADASFLKLQAELSQTENRISFGRKVYNESVLAYNNAQQEFPANLVAARFRHTASPTFKASGEAANPPSVNF